MSEKLSKFKAGHYRQQFQYKSFTPSPINIDYEWTDKKINLLLEEANRNLGELNAYSILVPDVDFFIQMHIYKEATASSRIEGTKTEIDDALLPEEEIGAEKKDDWTEVQNYTKAMNSAISDLERLPLSIRLIKETHKILMDGARGKHKQPGEIRTSQNWIGGSSLSDAFFIPPHANEVPELLSDLEIFWHNQQLSMPHLIRIAISHYQFETIHPFQDGNGRIGRLLITLYLVSNGILKKPTLYLSDFFEKNRGSYYDALTLVRQNDDLEHWLKFFLNGVIETSLSGKRTFERVVELRHRCEDKLAMSGKKTKAGKELLKVLYSSPVVSSKKVMNALKLSHPSANSLIKHFENLGILKEVTGFKRNRHFVFVEYIDIFRR